MKLFHGLRKMRGCFDLHHVGLKDGFVPWRSRTPLALLAVSLGHVPRDRGPWRVFAHEPNTARPQQGLPPPQWNGAARTYWFGCNNELTINVPTPWTRSRLLLRIHYVHAGEFAIKVPASRKPLILHSSPCLRHGIEFAIPCPSVDATGKMPYAFGACSIRLLSCGDVVDHARGYVRFFLDDYSGGRDVGGQGQRYRVVGRR